MSSDSSSDSGSSSSSQTSSFDYESEAAGISNYAGSNFNDGQGGDRNTFDYEGAAYGTTPSTSYTDTSGSNIGGSDIDSTYTASGADFTPTYQPTIVDRVTDYVTGGGLVGMGIRAAQDVFGTPENQYAGITGEDGYGEGDYVSTLDDFAESRGLGTSYADLDLEGQAFIDQEAFNAGYRSPAFQDLYQSGDTQNIQNLNQPESDLVKQLIPQAPFAISGGQAPQSMVNDYFANIGSQSGLSSQLENDYNTAKANVANTMAVTPLTQQFGYSTAPYGALTAQNTGTNPFNIPYLQTRGLI